jgi:hypothetical protein
LYNIIKKKEKGRGDSVKRHRCTLGERERPQPEAGLTFVKLLAPVIRMNGSEI